MVKRDVLSIITIGQIVAVLMKGNSPMKSINLKKVLIPLVLAVVVLCVLFGVFVGRVRQNAGVTDEQALRSKPKAAGAMYIDPAVVAQGNGAWQGQNYITAAQSALNIVNQQRANAGLGALRWDDNLAACAMFRATEQPVSFSHTRPNGTDWYTVCPDLMYGENLAYGYSSPDQAVNAWMNSPAHKENILKPGFVSCGIGVYEANGTWYWSQEFGYY